MRILLLCHSFNSLSQRLFVELVELGHEVSVEFDVNEAVTIEAVGMFAPHLIVAPFLKRAIPQAVWTKLPCFIVHPGPPGDRGPSSLDWAILDRETEWGVTVLQATGDMDGGPVWAYRRFPMRAAAKSSIYRNEVTEAAASAVLEALERLGSGERQAPRFDELTTVEPCWRNLARQSDRAIDWGRDSTQTIVRKIASADGTPGVRVRLCGRDYYLHNAAPSDVDSRGHCPGTPIARSHGAIAIATRDGALWIGHVRDAGRGDALKLPAARVLAEAAEALPEVNGPADIRYEEEDGVGYLHFPFLNGAMGVGACQRLTAAFEAATQRKTRVIVLMGGPDFWSNGLDLNEIEAAGSAAEQSWANINAIDDFSEAIIGATGHIVISALCGNAGAGGVFLARAADEVWMRRGVILNPHYKDMGNLYGSELWTYLLPKYAGELSARRIMQSRLPMGAPEAARLGLADRVVDMPHSAFQGAVRVMAQELAKQRDIETLIAEKRRARARDEAKKPLSAYRDEELARMRRNFFGFDSSYHVARYNFVHKVARSRTPLTLARHRDKRLAGQGRLEEAAQ